MNTIDRFLVAALAATFITAITATDLNAGKQPFHRQTLSNLHVNDIVQDDMGFVWIGTANGLSRCNGLEGYDVYFNDPQSPTSLPNNHVTALEIIDGKLWIASYGGVASKPTGKNQFTRYALADKNNENVSINGFIKHKSKPLCYGAKGVYEIDTVENRLYKRISSPKTVRAVLEDRNGLLWVADDDNLTCCNSRLKPVSAVKFPESMEISNMLKHNNTVFITSDKGIFRRSEITSSLWGAWGR